VDHHAPVIGEEYREIGAAFGRWDRDNLSYLAGSGVRNEIFYFEFAM
jgi:hypothetical protein